MAFKLTTKRQLILPDYWRVHGWWVESLSVRSSATDELSNTASSFIVLFYKALVLVPTANHLTNETKFGGSLFSDDLTTVDSVFQRTHRFSPNIIKSQDDNSITMSTSWIPRGSTQFVVSPVCVRPFLATAWCLNHLMSLSRSVRVDFEDKFELGVEQRNCLHCTWLH